MVDAEKLVGIAVELTKVVGGVRPLLLISAATIPPPAIISAPMIGPNLVSDSVLWVGSGAGMPGDGMLGNGVTAFDTGASMSSGFSVDTPLALHRQLRVGADTLCAK